MRRDVEKMRQVKFAVTSRAFAQPTGQNEMLPQKREAEALRCWMG
jgi:hypothetical protein